MPTYDYQCEDCKHKFSLVMSISQHEKKKISCPKCRKKEVRQLIMPFLAQTSKKS